MLKIKKMTDQQLNNELSRMEMHRLGWKLVGDTGPWIKPDGSYSSGRYRDYCTELASLEIQREAINIDAEQYMRNLEKVAVHPAHHKGEDLISYEVAAWMANASPRERAEAAYTLFNTGLDVDHE
ncbi:hypothetical protein [Paenibacillus polymyxa]|uniref:Phage ABA sandwich domain-containing protein n=1 Tax=Paenibacillus polymyxa (strain SC2) TaxID=886882 RepID=E3EK77_PAEPS|nr:hypothetical protein [Paenibacillus polymyxa]ADO59786.1 hypothetical protein PPSC2_26230 [Paenibacillus polymyxa SC2]WPQ59977.1 hypothetical protein SKN87_27425 [Paenibacillus polymyxa]